MIFTYKENDMTKSKLLQIRVTSKQKRQLDNLIKQLHITKSKFIRQLVEEAIEKNKSL